MHPLDWKILSKMLPCKLCKGKQSLVLINKFLKKFDTNRNASEIIITVLFRITKQSRQYTG